VNPGIISALFAIVLIASNWSWSHTVKDSNITTTLNFDLPGIAAIFCAGALIYFGFRLIRLLRAILDEQVRVPRDLKLVAWMPLILILPLFAKLYYSTWYSTDDIVTTNTCGYGSDHSTLLAVLAAVLIIVFQAFMNLNNFRQNKPSPSAAPSPISVAPPPRPQARYFSPLS
jgi:formate hydrogenlyase subunit 4